MDWRVEPMARGRSRRIQVAAGVTPGGAFRRRRSLLLLNLESQVELSELPWVAVIDPYRRTGLDARERARQTLEQLVTVAATGFPQQILPNKLLQEVRALASRRAS